MLRATDSTPQVPRLLQVIGHLTNWYIRFNRKCLRGAAGLGVGDTVAALNTQLELLLTVVILPGTKTPGACIAALLNGPRTLDEREIEKKTGCNVKVIQLGRAARDQCNAAPKTYILEELNVTRITVTGNEQDYGIRLGAKVDWLQDSEAAEDGGLDTTDDVLVQYRVLAKPEEIDVEALVSSRRLLFEQSLRGPVERVQGAASVDDLIAEDEQDLGNLRLLPIRVPAAPKEPDPGQIVASGTTVPQTSLKYWAWIPLGRGDGTTGTQGGHRAPKNPRLPGGGYRMPVHKGTSTLLYERLVDVLILGGGPAGLSCAGGLARQLHTAIVFSHEQFRNARASHMHNVAGWDHHHPREFRQKAKADILNRYGDTIQFKNVEIRSVRKLEEGKFEAVDADGDKYVGRRVVIASGVRDIMPSLPGYEKLWGRGIFHCLFCHGYEERGATSAGILATALLANPAFAPVIARMAGRLAGTVNVYTNGAGEELIEEIRPILKNTKKYKFIDAGIKKLMKDPDIEGEAGVLVYLEDGTVNKEGFIAHVPHFELSSSFAKDLGVEVTPQGHIDVQSPFCNTSVPGVFAAGDCATFLKSVAQAMVMGSFVAAGIAHSVQAEDDVAE
ncbi:hypothetical protein DL769_003295 [Monosporascus sp. CRB-8-3]|nr:hypothetical protein DL769_003295 [Monosporascus sp. CRB-8-3]